METETATKTELITGEQLAEMGDVGRSELVEGIVVMKSPTGSRHGTVEVNISSALHAFVRSHKLGTVKSGEVGVYTRRNPDTVRAPDILYISRERSSQVKSASFLDIAPELVVEVMSPDDRWVEVMEKLNEYFQAGVKLVWVANPKDKTVIAYRSPTDARRFSSDDTLPGDDVLRGFSVPVAVLFEE